MASTTRSGRSYSSSVANSDIANLADLDSSTEESDCNKTVISVASSHGSEKKDSPQIWTSVVSKKELKLKLKLKQSKKGEISATSSPQTQSTKVSAPPVQAKREAPKFLIPEDYPKVSPQPKTTKPKTFSEWTVTFFDVDSKKTSLFSLSEKQANNFLTSHLGDGFVRHSNWTVAQRCKKITLSATSKAQFDKLKTLSLTTSSSSFPLKAAASQEKVWGCFKASAKTNPDPKKLVIKDAVLGEGQDEALKATVLESIKVEKRADYKDSRTKSWQPSHTVVFTCVGPKLPAELLVEDTWVPVAPFVHPVRHCTRCLSYSHGHSKCQKIPGTKVQCGWCAKGHHTNACTNKSKQQCFHCHEAHPVWAKHCKARRQEALINETRAGRPISRHQAIKELEARKKASEVEQPILAEAVPPSNPNDIGISDNKPGRETSTPKSTAPPPAVINIMPTGEKSPPREADSINVMTTCAKKLDFNKTEETDLKERTLKVLEAVRKDNLNLTDRLIAIELTELKTINELKEEIKNLKITILQNENRHKNEIQEIKSYIQTSMQDFHKVVVKCLCTTSTISGSEYETDSDATTTAGSPRGTPSSQTPARG